MTRASREQYKKWVVEALEALSEASPQKVYDWVRENCQVPDQDMKTITADGEIFFEKEIRFARWSLRSEGVVDGAERGTWRLLK